MKDVYTMIPKVLKIKMTKPLLEKFANGVLERIEGEGIDPGEEIDIVSDDPFIKTKLIIEIVCEFCFGTGEVSCDEQDASGNWERGVGTMPCRCKADHPLEDDFSGATDGDR